jgi:FdhE protein
MAARRDPWAARRRRAQVLRTRYGFAAEVLTLYIGLTKVWNEGAADIGRRVVQAVADFGPSALAEGIRDLDADAAMAAWLGGEDLPPMQRFLARACLMPGPAVAGAPPADERHCPRCGGLPQLSFRPVGEPLVSEPRRLVCSRCAEAWSYSRAACAFCGETESSQRTLYAEDGGELFPHLSVDACRTCSRYVIDVDLGRDREAVPDVDELAALPLDLYAADQGLTKITPNIMGL